MISWLCQSRLDVVESKSSWAPWSWTKLSERGLCIQLLEHISPAYQVNTYSRAPDLKATQISVSDIPTYLTDNR